MYLLDTNVPSESRRRHPDPQMVEWLQNLPERSLYLSALTIGEIRKGVEIKRLRAPAQADERTNVRVLDPFEGPRGPREPGRRRRGQRRTVPPCVPAVGDHPV